MKNKPLTCNTCEYCDIRDSIHYCTNTSIANVFDVSTGESIAVCYNPMGNCPNWERAGARNEREWVQIGLGALCLLAVGFFFFTYLVFF